jgi:hypothetical protein
MNTAPYELKRRIRLLVAAAGAITVCLGATPSSAQTPLATVVVYEVAESLTFKGRAHKNGTTAEEFQRRLAEASLLGKAPWITAAAGTPFASADFLVARANSAVNLTTGVGPVRGAFNLLTDLDKDRNSLDTLLVIENGKIEGTLDLTTAMQGFAKLTGTWKIDKQVNGSLAGFFLIAFPMPGAPGYWYLNLVPGSCAAGSTELSIPGAQVCSVTPEETLLGIPLTKAVFTFFD